METNRNHMTIADIHIGKRATIENVNGDGGLRRHLLDMGLVPGTVVEMVRHAPMGDPMEVCLHGYMLSLRKGEAALIEVSDGEVKKLGSEPDGKGATSTDNYAYNNALHEHYAHPGYGEGGKYHNRAEADPLPAGSTINIALMGQPNSGKTTLFNQFTGSKRHAGNYPGQTVGKETKPVVGKKGISVTDLPGICSLTPYSTEEAESRDWVMKQRPEVIINVVDASNLERHLYLTMQLMELEMPMVVALNMTDELKRDGGSIRVNELERTLGLPVVPISAIDGNGIDELLDHALHVARNQERPERRDVCEKGGAMHRCLHSIMHLIEDHAEKAQMPLRYAASMVVEQNQQVVEALHLSNNELEMISHILVQL
ncbi:MAG: FeoA domain-containing protein, partial [Bacteroidales bacterium]|nr:FeoA domain-containing protein [Candidatus Colimorpha onthohippi]